MVPPTAKLVLAGEACVTAGRLIVIKCTGKWWGPFIAKYDPRAFADRFPVPADCHFGRRLLAQFLRLIGGEVDARLTGFHEIHGPRHRNDCASDAIL